MKEFSLDRKITHDFVSAFFDAILEIVNRDSRLELRGFGVFKKHRLRGRFIRNPKTGVEVYAPERYTVRFKPSNLFRRSEHVERACRHNKRKKQGGQRAKLR
ncbi:MAG: HU family DNA-binding protein [Aquificaceae bacterium]